VVVSTLVVEAAFPVALVAVALARAAALLLLAGVMLTAAAAPRFPPLLLPPCLGQVGYCLLPRLLLLQLLEPLLLRPPGMSPTRHPRSASPNQYSHPPSPPVVPYGVALQAGQFLLFTDGGAHNNNQSGCRVLHPAGAGWVIYQVDDSSSSPPPLSLVQFGGARLGQSSHNTNNVAEYNALLCGLHRACDLGVKHLAVVRVRLTSGGPTSHRPVPGGLGALTSFPFLTRLWNLPREGNLSRSTSCGTPGRATQLLTSWPIWRSHFSPLTGGQHHDHAWEQALQFWRSHQSLGPTPYISTSPAAEPSPPLSVPFNSAGGKAS